MNSSKKPSRQNAVSVPGVRPHATAPKTQPNTSLLNAIMIASKLANSGAPAPNSGTRATSAEDTSCKGEGTPTDDSLARAVEALGDVQAPNAGATTEPAVPDQPEKTAAAAENSTSEAVNSAGETVPSQNGFAESECGGRKARTENPAVSSSDVSLHTSNSTAPSADRTDAEYLAKLEAAKVAVEKCAASNIFGKKDERIEKLGLALQTTYDMQELGDPLIEYVRNHPDMPKDDEGAPKTNDLALLATKLQTRPATKELHKLASKWAKEVEWAVIQKVAPTEFPEFARTNSIEDCSVFVAAHKKEKRGSSPKPRTPPKRRPQLSFTLNGYGPRADKHAGKIDLAGHDAIGLEVIAPLVDDLSDPAKGREALLKLADILYPVAIGEPAPSGAADDEGTSPAPSTDQTDVAQS